MREERAYASRQSGAAAARAHPDGAQHAGLFTIGIAALFLVGFLLLVVFGARTYRGTVESRSRNGEIRAQLSYFSAIVKAGDRSGAVYVRESAYGPSLVVEEPSGYALRVYCKDGQLLEDYAKADADLRPEGAQVIGRTERFEVELEGGLLTVSTDEGQVLLHLRSE